MTDCRTPLTFDFLPRKAGVADFCGGLITSDAGLLPVRQLDQRPGWSAAVAYNLMRTYRDMLAGTQLETASVETIRSRLMKIGARVRRTARRVWVHTAGGFRLREVLAKAHRAILHLHPPPLLG